MDNRRLIDVKWREVPFEIMLKCDGEIKCECWLLNNSINKYGVDLRRPMMLNDFLILIGTHLTSMNCSSLFEQSKWYVIDDGVQPDFFLAKASDPIPTIKPGAWAIHPDLEQVRIMDAPVVHVLKGKDEYEVYLSDLEVSHD